MRNKKYGPNHKEVEAFIVNINRFANAAAYTAYDATYADAYTAYDATYADAYTAYDAAYDADAYADAAYADAAYADATYAADADADANAAYATDARYWFRWYFGYGARALAIKHLIGKNGFTQEHFDRLTEVCLIVNPKASIEEIKALAMKTKSKLTLLGLNQHVNATQEIKVIISLKLLGMGA